MPMEQPSTDVLGVTRCRYSVRMQYDRTKLRLRLDRPHHPESWRLATFLPASELIAVAISCTHYRSSQTASRARGLIFLSTPIAPYTRSQPLLTSLSVNQHDPSVPL
jgi:hypothetical protein